MINNIYTYGCSFSYPFWIDESKTYTSLLSKKYKCNYYNKSFPALCNDEIFTRLTNDLDKFKKDDLIVYQFTAYGREGFYINNNDDKYLSTAGLSRNPKENREMLDKWAGGRDTFKVTDNDIELLLDYTNTWSIYTLRNRFYRVFNLLEFLKKNVGINYQFLFFDNLYYRFCGNIDVIKFPLKNNVNNTSIIDWVVENKITLSDSHTGVDPNDKHPNEYGHMGIFDKIVEKIEKF